jgi:hypothetical protein
MEDDPLITLADRVIRDCQENREMIRELLLEARLTTARMRDVRECTRAELARAWALRNGAVAVVGLSVPENRGANTACAPSAESTNEEKTR